MITLDLWRLLILVGWLLLFTLLTWPIALYLRRVGRPRALSLLLLIPGVSLFGLYLMRLRR
jgi:hypothetical protein